jgi:FAD:protein FMN transferase
MQYSHESIVAGARPSAGAATITHCAADEHLRPPGQAYLAAPEDGCSPVNVSHCVKLACHAMATRFEFVLHGENPVALRAAGEEAIEEINRLEGQLSLYRPSSEIAHVNARAAHEPVRVSPGVFALLERAQELTSETSGAFDITIGPLVRCWGFMGGTGKIPAAEELADARNKVGMHLVQLNRQDFTVRFATEGVMLDLGAIGKGHAIDCASEILRDAGVTSALLHSGTSTVSAIGTPLGEDGWKIAIERPGTGVHSTAADSDNDSVASPRPLTTIPLRDGSLSVSAIWGKSFEADGQTLGHVLDPRTGVPVTGAVLAAVVLPSATETDALSTALLTLGKGGHESLAKLRPGMRTLLVSGTGENSSVESNGLPMTL